jgi:hypothetical protein
MDYNKWMVAHEKIQIDLLFLKINLYLSLTSVKFIILIIKFKKLKFIKITNIHYSNRKLGVFNGCLDKRTVHC